VSLQPRKLPRSCRTQTQSKLRAREVSPAGIKHTKRVRVQPYGGSYFLPGMIANTAATFLLDSECTTNLLSRPLFNTFSPGDRAGLESHQREHGRLADRLCIPFYDIIELTGKVRDQAISEMFIVNQLKEDTIFGMPFLMRHKCHIDFSNSAVVMAERELACVDKVGCPLVVGAQVRSCTIPGHSHTTIHCRVNFRWISKLGVEEGAQERSQLTNSLSRLDMQGEILVQ